MGYHIGPRLGLGTYVKNIYNLYVYIYINWQCIYIYIVFYDDEISPTMFLFFGGR